MEDIIHYPILGSLINQILIVFAYSFIKLSIGFFLLRLADRTKWRTFLIGVLGEHAQQPDTSHKTDDSAQFSSGASL